MPLIRAYFIPRFPYFSYRNDSAEYRLEKKLSRPPDVSNRTKLGGFTEPHWAAASPSATNSLGSGRCATSRRFVSLRSMRASLQRSCRPSRRYQLARCRRKTGRTSFELPRCPASPNGSSLPTMFLPEESGLTRPEAPRNRGRRLAGPAKLARTTFRGGPGLDPRSPSTFRRGQGDFLEQKRMKRETELKRNSNFSSQPLRSTRSNSRRHPQTTIIARSPLRATICSRRLIIAIGLVS